jgi:hypothetical protein
MIARTAGQPYTHGTDNEPARSSLSLEQSPNALRLGLAKGGRPQRALAHTPFRPRAAPTLHRWLPAPPACVASKQVSRGLLPQMQRGRGRRITPPSPRVLQPTGPSPGQAAMFGPPPGRPSAPRSHEWPRAGSGEPSASLSTWKVSPDKRSRPPLRQSPRVQLLRSGPARSDPSAPYHWFDGLGPDGGLRCGSQRWSNRRYAKRKDPEA